MDFGVFFARRPAVAPCRPLLCSWEPVHTKNGGFFARHRRPSEIGGFFARHPVILNPLAFLWEWFRVFDALKISGTARHSPAYLLSGDQGKRSSWLPIVIVVDGRTRPLASLLPGSYDFSSPKTLVEDTAAIMRGNNP